jgi:hypothetical protein
VALMLTRVNVGDFEAWKPMFDQDPAGVRANAKSWRVFRGIDDPGQVFIQTEFASVDEAQEARQKLLDSGVLDRFQDRYGPTVVEEADSGSG